MDLYRVRNVDTPGNQLEWVDENGKICKSIFTFKEDAPIQKKMTVFFKRRVIYEEKE